MTEFELKLFASMNNIFDLMGFDTEEDKLVVTDEEHFHNSMMKAGFYEMYEEDKYRFSAFGQRVINMMATPHAWISIKDKNNNHVRNIYSMDIDYLSVDIKDGEITFVLLPLIDYAIGAYARMLESLVKTDNITEVNEDEARIEISAYSDADMTISIVPNASGDIAVINQEGKKEIVSFNEEECVNRITAWLLEELGKIEE